MDLSSIYQLFIDHPGLFASVIPLALSSAHSRLGNYPIIQVLTRYAGILPVARIAAVELAQAVVTQWGPGERADMASVVAELHVAPQTVVGPPHAPEPGPGISVPAPVDGIAALAAAHPELVKRPQPPYGG